MIRSRPLPWILSILIASLLAPPAFSKAVRNVILCIGDGMGIASVTGARMLKGERLHLPNTAAANLFMDSFPYTALSRTYSLDNLVTDSAAGMTAVVTGEKTNNGNLSVIPSADGTSLRSLGTILELAEASGRSTGVISNTRVTHATPAACFAHEQEREAETTIARQLLPGDSLYNHGLGNGLEVVLGGGRSVFFGKTDSSGHPLLDEEGAVGSRADGRDLRAEFRRAGYTYIWNREGLTAIDPAKTDHLIGLFAPSYMAYEDVRERERRGEPSLSEMVTKAVQILSRDPDGFFLMIEGGRIDHALHANQAVRALNETLAFDESIRTAASLVDPEETLIIVTADHDHTMVIGGSAPADSGVTGFGGRDRNGRPYPMLSFGTGPGWGSDPTFIPTREWLRDPESQRPAAVLLPGDTHGAMDLPAYAWGSAVYAASVHGTLQNSDLFRVMRAALLGN